MIKGKHEYFDSQKNQKKNRVLQIFIDLKAPSFQVEQYIQI